MQPILKINLTDQTADEFIVPVNGSGFSRRGVTCGADTLFGMTRDLNPLSPESPCYFSRGAYRHSGPTTGRFVICGKSPATGLWAESNCGGFWVRMRRLVMTVCGLQEKLEVPYISG